MQSCKLLFHTKAYLGCVPKVAIGKSTGIHQSICGGFLESSADFGIGTILGGNLATERNHNDFKAQFYHSGSNLYNCRVWVQDSWSSTQSCTSRVRVGARSNPQCVRNGPSELRSSILGYLHRPQLRLGVLLSKHCCKKTPHLPRGTYVKCCKFCKRVQLVGSKDLKGF